MPAWLTQDDNGDFSIDGAEVDRASGVIAWAIRPKSRVVTQAKKAVRDVLADKGAKLAQIDQEKARLEAIFGPDCGGHDDDLPPAARSANLPTGSTTAIARFVLISNEHKFGTVIAAALSKPQPVAD